MCARVPLTQARIVGLTLALASTFLICRGARAAPEPSAAPASDVYVLTLEGLADSLRAEIGLSGTDDGASLWAGTELESAAIRLRDLLARRGDAAATVRLTLVRGKGPRSGSAVLQVERFASDRATPGDVIPVLQSAVPIAAALSDSVASAFHVAARGAATVDAVAAGLSAARDVLIDAGFYSAEVGLDSLSFSEEATRVHLRVVSGPPAVVERIELPGAVATKPAAAATLAGLRPGTFVTPAVLTAARERLSGSGLFTVVGDPRVTLGETPGAARVVIPVEEQRLSRFEGALGITREGGVTGLVDLALGNIAGSGRAAGLRWYGPGGGRAEYAAHYREPALFRRRIEGTLALEAQVAESLFTHTRWSLSVGTRPTPGTSASLALLRSGSVYSGLARGSSAAWSLAGRWGIDRMRPALNPTSGFHFAGGVEGGRRIERLPGAEATSRGLLRADLALEGAAALGPRRALYGALRSGATVLPGELFPAEELRFVGGAEGLRGHADRAFGGNRVVAGSLEHRWLTDGQGGRLYLFGDLARHDLDAPLVAGTALVPPSLQSGGAAVSLARTILSRGWEFGYGAGLRTKMASGLIGLELGFAPGEPLRRATVHVRYASTW